MSDGIDGYVLMERDFRINMFKQKREMDNNEK